MSVGFYVVERNVLLHTVADGLNRSFFSLEENIQLMLQQGRANELQIILDKTPAINHSVAEVSLSWDGKYIDASSSRSLIGNKVSPDFIDIANIHDALIENNHALFKSHFPYFKDTKKREATLLIHIDKQYVFGRLIHTSTSFGVFVGALLLPLIFLAFFILRNVLVLPLGRVTQHAREANINGVPHFIHEFTQLDKILGRSFKTLKESNQRFDAALKAIPDLMFEIQRSGKYLNVWGGAGDFLAVPKNELLGRSIDEMLPREAAQEIYAAISEAEITSYSFGRKLCLPLSQGDRWFELSVSKSHTDMASEATYIILSRDITERRLAETDIRIAATAFESQMSLMITDTNSVILRANQAFLDETGYTLEELIGQTPHLLRSGRHDEGFYTAMRDILRSTGKWQGEIWDRRKNGEIYPKWMTISAVKGADGLVTHYVGSHIDITERKASEDKIKLLAFYDPLTQLPNRRLLIDRLQQALSSSTRSGKQGALIFIDLDNFKILNDTRGHDIGDLLLQQVAQRIESCVREADTAARLGGDEFVVILEGLSEQPIEAAEQAKSISEKILFSLNQPYQLSAHQHHSTPSIGVTLLGHQQETVDDLLQQADIAMYQAKKAGRNTIRFFDPKMQVAINERSSLEEELRLALKKQQFHLYYQIQVDGYRNPLGAEALIRWRHPQRGMISPFHFIPLAEETGLILPIGQWVLESACAQIKVWEQQATTRDLVLAVNVSAKQFNQADFVAQVNSVVQRHDINPSRLKLELTESMLAENLNHIIASMTALKEIGIQFSLDDFGTGYSSLQYLKKLPLNQLKIDQSFVRDMAVDVEDNAIVQTIIAMAKGLHLDIIAEGVETEEQRELLHDLGCYHCQGYLFSKPVPIAEFEALLDLNNRC